jgi:hypothetical protein
MKEQQRLRNSPLTALSIVTFSQTWLVSAILIVLVFSIKFYNPTVAA